MKTYQVREGQRYVGTFDTKADAIDAMRQVNPRFAWKSVGTVSIGVELLETFVGVVDGVTCNHAVFFLSTEVEDRSCT